MNSTQPVVDLLEIPLNDVGGAARWDEFVRRSPDSDIYHRAAYVLASAELEQSQPLGLIISLKNQQYLLPMLVRPIPGANGQSWFDASTPYGYGGVICLGLDSGVASPNGAALFHCLHKWCTTRKLVCCVLRSHPLLAQDWLFAHVDFDFVRITRRGQTMALPLQRWDDARQCPPELSKGRRSDLALARRNLLVSWNTFSDQCDAVKQFRIFQVLYENTMRRVGATEFFHFPWSYYERLSALGPDVGVAIAWHGDHAVGGAVFMAGPAYAHYHLSASDESGHKYKASTLLVVEGAKWARQRGCLTLHLGGGMLVNDSLSAFKRSFGGEPHQFGYITLISDPGRYDSMSSLATPPWPYDQRTTSRADANAPPQ